jgi:hypothetical protein
MPTRSSKCAGPGDYSSSGAGKEEARDPGQGV